MFKEFKAFILRGNVIDLAVAVVIGAAFTAIVTSLVDDIVTPLLLTPALKAAQVEDIENLVWNGVKYGQFLAAIIKFILIAFVLFLLVKAANQFKKKEEAAPAGPSQEQLLTEIRDLLKR